MTYGVLWFFVFPWALLLWFRGKTGRKGQRCAYHRLLLVMLIATSAWHLPFLIAVLVGGESEELVGAFLGDVLYLYILIRMAATVLDKNMRWSDSWRLLAFLRWSDIWLAFLICLFGLMMQVVFLLILLGVDASIEAYESGSYFWLIALSDLMLRHGYVLCWQMRLAALFCLPYFTASQYHARRPDSVHLNCIAGARRLSPTNIIGDAT